MQWIILVTRSSNQLRNYAFVFVELVVRFGERNKSFIQVKTNLLQFPLQQTIQNRSKLFYYIYCIQKKNWTLFINFPNKQSTPKLKPQINTYSLKNNFTLRWRTASCRHGAENCRLFLIYLLRYIICNLYVLHISSS